MTSRLYSDKGEDENKVKIKDALTKGNAVAFKRLVKGGVDVNATYRYNNSLLHEAVQSGRADFVEILLQNKAAVNKTNEFGRTPLHLACRRGLLQCVQLLMKHGANPNLTTEEGSTPMNIAVWRGKGEALELVKSLVGAGAKVNRADGDGWLPIHWAAKLNYIPVVKYLMERGSLIDTWAGKGTGCLTPFMEALKNSNLLLARLLLLHGVDVNTFIEKLHQGKTSVEIVLQDKYLLAEQKALFVYFLYEMGFSPKGKHYLNVKQEMDKATNQDYGKYSLLDSENLDQSLASLCRLKVRSHVRQCSRGKTTSIVNKLRMLPLPNVLIDYVTFADELKKFDS